MSATKTRKLKMHNDMLMSVIKRQATTVPKAILEAAMNANEAGADKFDISFDVENNVLKMTDNGTGITTHDEITRFFETFGTPHDESEGKIWAQFRMGRGQIFAYGRTVWRTGTFEMEVDIKHTGLEYSFQDGLPMYPGTYIELNFYDDQIGTSTYRTLDAFEEAVKYQLEFMPFDINFNGKRITFDLESLNWDVETDDAYFMFGQGNGLKVYNLGAYVNEYRPSQFGVVGIVVSKKMLIVNFARTDIHMRECETWQGIAKVLQANRIKKTRKTAKRLDSHERTALLRDLRDGELTYGEVRTLSLLRTSNDKVLNLETVVNNVAQWTFAELGDQVADRLLESGEALCIDNNVLAELNYSGDEDEFFEWLLRHADMCNRDINRLHQMRGQYRAFDKLDECFDRAAVILPESKWSVVERRIVKVLNGYTWPQTRRFCIGISDAYLAWTDGSSYIALSRFFLKGLSLSSYHSAAKLIAVIYHEFAHDCNTAETHFHGSEFYLTYHNLTLNGALWIIGDFGQAMRKFRVEERQAKAEAAERKREEKQREKLLNVTKPKRQKKVAAVVNRDKNVLDIDVECDTIEESNSVKTVVRRRRR